MFKTRQQIEAEETSVLSPFAVKASESLGRKHAESPHPYRTAFQRDRARIIHSSAFRRLDGKTQVFLNGSGDHYRTRLTHTMEVASVTRTIARALGLNEDLAESIALAHDLGHPPFGHAGEEALDRLMTAHGGFNHNTQSLRIVESLESRYPRHQGLNLSFEVIEGLQKHNRNRVLPDGCHTKSLSLEAQVADLADEITYYSHDLDDGLDSGLINPEILESVTIWNEALTSARHEFRRFNIKKHRGYVIRCLVNREVEDAVITSAKAIEKANPQSVAEVRRRPSKLIGFSRETKSGNAELRKFLFKHLYQNPAVADVHRRSCEVLEKLFARMLAKPSLIGSKSASRIPTEGLPRAVADYLSGMTDRYCIEAYESLSH